MERFNNRTDGYHIFRFIITTNKKKKKEKKRKKNMKIFSSKIHITFRWYKIIIASIYFSLYFNYHQFIY